MSWPASASVSSETWKLAGTSETSPVTSQWATRTSAPPSMESQTSSMRTLSCAVPRTITVPETSASAVPALS